MEPLSRLTYIREVIPEAKIVRQAWVVLWMLVGLAAVAPACASSAPQPVSAGEHRPAPPAPAPTPPPTPAPTAPEASPVDRACFGELRWTTSPHGEWGLSEPFAGPEAFERWRRARECADHRLTAVLVKADLNASSWLNDRCELPRVSAAEWTRACEALPTKADLEEQLRRLATSEAGAELVAAGRSDGDPLAQELSETFGGKGPQYESYRLAVYPVAPDAFLGCMTSADADWDGRTSGAFLARWKERWGAAPYEVHGGGFVLHVASPPRDPEAAYRLAVELARYNYEMGIFGEEEFLRQAASHFWYFWWD